MNLEQNMRSFLAYNIIIVKYDIYRHIQNLIFFISYGFNHNYTYFPLTTTCLDNCLLLTFNVNVDFVNYPM